MLSYSLHCFTKPPPLPLLAFWLSSFPLNLSSSGSWGLSVLLGKRKVSPSSALGARSVSWQVIVKGKVLFYYSFVHVMGITKHRPLIFFWFLTTLWGRHLQGAGGVSSHRVKDSAIHLTLTGISKGNWDVMRISKCWLKITLLGELTVVRSLFRIFAVGLCIFVFK